MQMVDNGAHVIGQFLHADALADQGQLGLVEISILTDPQFTPSRSQVFFLTLAQ